MGYRLRATLAGLALVLSACGVHQATTPTATGPSGFATTVTMTANPDSISQDGASQSAIVVTALNASGAALSGLTVRLSTMVAGVVQDFGVLSARSVVTDSAGHANAVYTAPPSSPLTGGTGVIVSVVASPIGTDAQTTNSRQVDIRLVPPGVILPPAGTPTASFTVSPTPVLASVPSIFDASSSTPGTGSAGIVSYSWNFGDGGQASGRSVGHAFTAQASFIVTLTVVNDRGVSASTTQTVVVAAGGTNLPTASFTFSPSSPVVGTTLFFNASASVPGAGHTITSYRWTFGDNGTASGVTASHAYTAGGTFVVQLTVTDEVGQSNTSAGTSITVGSGSATASFTVSPTGPVVGQTVFFNASTSSAGPGHTLVSFSWTFGDGSIGSGVTINHKYFIAGGYIVQLTVTDETGRSTIAPTQTVSVGPPPPPPNPHMTFLPAVPSPGAVVTFDGSTSTASSPATVVAWQWNFGDFALCPDGCRQTGVTVTHSYAVAGSYSVTLTVTDSVGQSGSSSPPVTVVVK